jgi:aldose sugar dehydrogenase
VKSGVPFDVTVLAKGLERPWAVEPLPGGDFLITEKPGRLRIVLAKGEVGPPVGGLLPVGSGGPSAVSWQGGLPPVTARGQGGLLDVALSPDFSRDRTIFWSFSGQREGGSGTSVARGVLTQDRRNLKQVRIIFRGRPSPSRLFLAARTYFPQPLRHCPSNAAAGEAGTPARPSRRELTRAGSPTT